MANPNKKRGCGCFALLLLLAAGAILLLKGWNGDRLTRLPTVLTETAPSYTTLAEAETLSAEPADYTPLRHYRTTLTGEEVPLYETIAAAISGFAPSVTGMRDVDPDRLFEILNFVSYDYPEYFWFEGKASTETTSFGSTTLTDLTLSYTMTPGEAAHIQADIRRVTDDYLRHMAGMTETEKVEYVYHRLGLDTIYDLDHRDQSFCTVLLENTGLCAGYARSMQYILSRAGMDVIYLSGTAHTGEAHSWNVVKVDGQYYHTDATWGDPLVDGIDPGDGSNQNFAYLFLTTQEILQNRTMDTPDLIPACTAPSRNYYQSHGLLFDSVDDGLRAVLEDAAQADQPVTFQAADAASFAVLSAELQSDGGILSEIGRQVGLLRGMTRYAYAYRLDETTRCIRVEFTFTS